MNIYLRYKLLIIKEWLKYRKDRNQKRKEYRAFVKRNKKELKALECTVIETSLATNFKMVEVQLYSFLKNCNINPDVDDLEFMLGKYFKPISLGTTVYHADDLLNLKSYFISVCLK